MAILKHLARKNSYRMAELEKKVGSEERRPTQRNSEPLPTRSDLKKTDK